MQDSGLLAAVFLLQKYGYLPENRQKTCIKLPKQFLTNENACIILVTISDVNAFEQKE